MTHEQRLRQKHWHHKKRGYNAKHKAEERSPIVKDRRKIDLVAKELRHKGKGRVLKVKGETMPSIYPSNAQFYKSWGYQNAKSMRKKSMKFAAIWSLT